MSEYESFAITDIGVARKNNEDYILGSSEEKRWILADGVGGHEAGEIASELACTTIMNALDKNVPADEAILKAHKTIIRGVEQGIGKPGMATTIVVMVAVADVSHIFWVGDSRAYLIDKIGCSLLTSDHSLVQRLVDAGSITPEEAAVHPSKNVVYQVLGMEPPNMPEVAYTQQPLEKDDVILLCSDGLSDTVGEAFIFDTISQYSSLELAAEALIQQAIFTGSKDNISVLLIKKMSESHLKNKLKSFSGQNAVNDIKGLYSKLIAKAKDLS